MKGADIAIKKGTSSAGTLIAAGRTKRLEINSELVDITSDDNTNRWRAGIAAAGIKTMSVTLSGVLKDSATHMALLTDVNAQTIDAYGVVVGTLATFDGNFQITSVSMSGEYNGEMQFDVTLESAGDITIAAVT